MRKQYAFFWTMASLLLWGCGKHSPLSGIVQMDSEGIWTPVVYLVDPVTFDGVAASYTGRTIDSAAIGDDGTFAFETMQGASGPRLLQIVIQKHTERFSNALENEDLDGSNYFPVIWSGDETMEVTAQAEQFQQSFFIRNPSPENAAMLRLRDIRHEAFAQFLAGSGSGTHEASELLETENALHDFQKAIISFADETAFLLPALTAIRWVSVDGDYERVPEFLHRQCQKWGSVYPGHPWVIQLCEKASPETLPVLTGDQIPDFPLPMLSGDTTHLLSVLGGRLTLLDLWASWCAPCRAENRNTLVPLWDMHHEGGFQIVGYALDGSMKAWRNAIDKDGASRWLHASHLRGDDAPLLTALRIQTIPANFLIDSEGKVVAKNLHGKELTEFVETFLEHASSR